MSEKRFMFTRTNRFSLFPTC